MSPRTKSKPSTFFSIDELENRLSALEQVAHPPQPRLQIFVLDSENHLKLAWERHREAAVRQIAVDVQDLLDYLIKHGLAWEIDSSE